MIHIKILSELEPKLNLPVYATDGASGFDLMADIADNLILEPLARAAVSTGLSMAIPSGYEVQIRPRSGLALKHGITVLNAPGTIDSDYRGEVKVILINLSDIPFTIHRGDRIAQAVLTKVEKASIVEVDDLNVTVRGNGGFGSTGLN